MKSQAFARTAGIVFLIIGLVHFARIIYGWEAAINGWSIPISFSWVAVIVTAYLASQGLQLAKHG